MRTTRITAALALVVAIPLAFQPALAQQGLQRTDLLKQDLSPSESGKPGQHQQFSEIARSTRSRAWMLFSG